MAASELDYFDLQPSALLLGNEPFTSDTGQFTHLNQPGTTQNTFTVSGGVGTLSSASSDRNSEIQTGAAVTMPQLFVSIDVTARSGGGGTYDVIGLGVVKDGSNFIFASIDRVLNACRFQLQVAGSATFLPSIPGTTLLLDPPFTLGLSIVGNQLGFWRNSGSGWELVLTQDCSSTLDLKAMDWTGWKVGFQKASQLTSSWSFDNLKWGRYGAIGLRDLCVVTSEDGTPQISGNVAKVVATCAGPGGVPGACMGIFDVDLSAHTVTQVGAIMVSRGGKLQNDHAGQIIRNGSDSRLFVSSWGNTPSGSLVLEILHKLETGVDLTAGTHVVSGMATLALPELSGASGSGRYDPFVLKRGGIWHVGYTAVSNTSFAGAPFYFSYATSSDLVSFTAVGADGSHTGYEGSRLLLAARRVWGMGGGHTNVRCYDDTGAYRADLNVVTDGGSDTFPHPMIVPFGRKQILLTFDASRFQSIFQSWGDVRFYAAPRYK